MDSKKLPLLLTALLCLACGDGREPVAPHAGDGQVNGVVADEKTAAGIPDVVIVLLRDGRIVRATATDDAGKFAFADIARGSYTVRPAALELAGLALNRTAMTPEEAEVDVGGSPVHLVFAAVGLIPPQIVGYVRCSGSPVQGATLRVIGGETDATVTTSSTGKYGATDLAPGNYAVAVVSAPCPIEPLFRGVALRAGQQASVDFDG